MKLSKQQPIGIFDSGLGGLTVAKAIHLSMPNEQLIYFGDTAHFPYGDKSREAIIQYSTHITDFLLEQKCKVIVIACNTASANAYDAILQRVKSKCQVLNVIDPVVDFIAGSGYNKIGVIGTKSTIDSGTYADKIRARRKGIMVNSMATPLLAPMIEEGFIYDDISNAIIRNYLSRNEISDIETLILGCTHYPIISNQISRFYNFEIDIVESGKIIAASLQSLLSGSGILNDGKPAAGNKFYVSDYTRYFKLIAKMFFEEAIDLEKITLD